jgi:hypothetical protein
MRRKDTLPLGAEERTILNGGVPERVPVFVEGALSYFGTCAGKYRPSFVSSLSACVRSAWRKIQGHGKC